MKILINRNLPDDVFARIKGLAEYVCPAAPDSVFTKEELLERIGDCDGLLAAGMLVDREILDAAGTRMKAVANMAAGYDNIDWRYATSRKIAVLNTPHAVTHPTAELTIGLILSVMRGLYDWGDALRTSRVARTPAFTRRSVTTYGKTLGIIGFGRIGRAVAEKARGLGMQIIYYDIFRAPAETEEKLGATFFPDMDELIRSCDVLTLHCQYTPENHHMISDAQFDMMKPTAYLINAARGPLVEQAALLRALDAQKIAGAALDTFEFEPNIPEEFLSYRNLVIVPHIGAQTYDVRSDMVLEAATGLAEFLSGKRPYNLVNPEILD